MCCWPRLIGLARWPPCARWLPLLTPAPAPATPGGLLLGWRPLELHPQSCFSVERRHVHVKLNAVVKVPTSPLPPLTSVLHLSQRKQPWLGLQPFIDRKRRRQGLQLSRFHVKPIVEFAAFEGQYCRTIVTMAGDKPNVVFVLGGPGAGKGTQCAKIVDTFGYQHLSAGDLLREERSKPGSEFGELIESHITNGTIVPVEITCSLLERAMITSEAVNFLIDGFPRNQDNLEGWNKTMQDKVNVKFVLFFNCDEETCVKRCLSRGAAGSGRSDDNEESLKKRCNTYVKATMPIIQHFKEKDMVKEIDASRTPELVFEEVRKLFE